MHRPPPWPVELLRSRFVPSDEVRAKLMGDAQWLQVKVGPYDTTPHKRIIALVLQHLAPYGIHIVEAHCRFGTVCVVRLGP